MILESAVRVGRVRRSASLSKRSLERITGLYADVLCPEVVGSRFNIIIDASCTLDKDLLDALSSLGTGLKIQKVVSLGEGLTLLGADLPLQLQVALVGDQQNYHFGVRVVPHVFEPLDQIVKSLSPSYIVAEKRTDTAPIVAPGDGPEGFLAGGVPNLHFDVGAIIQLNGLGPEVHPNRQVVRVLEPVVDELQQQT